MAGYYVFTLAVHLSVHPFVRPSVVRTSVRLHFVSVRFINGFHSKFAYAFVSTMSGWRLFMGKSIIYHRIMAFVNVQKNGFMPLVPYLLGVSYETSQKMIKLTKALY